MEAGIFIFSIMALVIAAAGIEEIRKPLKKEKDAKLHRFIGWVFAIGGIIVFFVGLYSAFPENVIIQAIALIAFPLSAILLVLLFYLAPILGALFAIRSFKSKTTYFQSRITRMSKIEGTKAQVVAVIYLYISVLWISVMNSLHYAMTCQGLIPLPCDNSIFDKFLYFLATPLQIIAKILSIIGGR